MARPSFQATVQQREMVKTMSAYGRRHEAISKVLGISPKTLRKHFRTELDMGAFEANSQVVGSLFTMATSGKNAAASIFWLKTCRDGRETADEEIAPPELAPQIVVLSD